MRCCFDLSCRIQVIVSWSLPSSFNHIEVASGQDPGRTEIKKPVTFISNLGLAPEAFTSY